jgi:hypothetical protein
MLNDATVSVSLRMGDAEGAGQSGGHAGSGRDGERFHYYGV